MKEWHQSLDRMAMKDVARLRLNDRYHRVLTYTAVRDGVNSVGLPSVGGAMDPGS